MEGNGVKFEYGIFIFHQAPDVQPNAGISKRRIGTILEPVDEETLRQIATETFVKELGLEDDTVLRDGKVEIREVPAGTYLMEEESHKVSIGVGGIFTECNEVNFFD